MSESGWRIPNAIGALRCIALQWPEGQQWDTMLTGMLYTLTRGRSWDKATGIIKTGQAYGWTIFDANYPLMACDAQQDSLIEERIIYIGGGASDSEDDMGQVVTDVKLISPGVLRVFYGHCCFDDLTLETAAPVVADGVLDDVVGEGLPFATYSACEKAASIIEVTVAVGQAIWDYRWSPWLWVKRAQDAAGFDLIDSYVMLAGSSATNLAIMEGVDDLNIFDANKWERIQCRLATRLAADGTGWTNDDHASFLAWVYAEFATLESALLMGTFWSHVMLSIGYNDYDAVAKLHAVSTGADCACPDETPASPWPVAPTTSGWYVGEPLVSFDFSLTDASASKGLAFYPAHDIFGLVIDSFHNQTPWDGSGTLKRMSSEAEYPGSAQMFALSSDHLEDMGSGMYAFYDATLGNIGQQLGAQFIVGAGGSGTIETPTRTPSILQSFRFEVWSGDGVTRAYNFFNIRPIFNINSPSHSA